MALAQQLKDGTKESHSAAENTKFIAGFLRGVLSVEQYGKLLTNFYYVYSTLEDSLKSLQRDPVIGSLYFPELSRADSLSRDLRFYYGPNWRSLIKASPACDAYVARIREVEKESPYLLAAHCYTRYMGDLSGGQILKGIAQGALDNPEGEGFHFYEFDKIPNAKEFKVGYRSTLDNLNLDQKQKDAIVTEANYAFRLNMDMFDEMEGTGDTFGRGLFKVVVGLVKRKLFGGNK